MLTLVRVCVLCPFSAALDAAALCLPAWRLVVATYRLAVNAALDAEAMCAPAWRLVAGAGRLAVGCTAAAGERLAAQPTWRVLEGRLEDILAAAFAWGSACWQPVAGLALGLLQGGLSAAGSKRRNASSVPRAPWR